MKREEIFIAIRLIVAVLAFSGCYRKVEETDIAGNYVARRGFATEELQLLANHQFVQEVHISSSKTVSTARGTWRFDSQDSDIYFSSDFLVVADGRGNFIADYDNRRNTAASILPVRKGPTGHTQIGLDPATPYEKTNGR